MVREANKNDLDEILQLYLYLHEKSIPEDSQHLRSTWDNIINDANHHLIVCEIDGKIVASCVCVIIPNLTRNVRPYAFVENVVTHREYRKKGYATDCLNFAKRIAEENHCYKVLTDYFHLLREWEKKYAPKQPDEEWNPLFAEALHIRGS